MCDPNAGSALALEGRRGVCILSHVIRPNGISGKLMVHRRPREGLFVSSWHDNFLARRPANPLL